MLPSKPRRAFLTLLPIIPLLFLLHHLLLPRLQKRCPPITILTAPNHGTHKLLTRADNCASTTASQHLWTLTHPSVSDALTLVSRSSVAILPSGFYNHTTDVRTFLRLATGNKVPVLLLLRNLQDAWDGQGELQMFQKEMKQFFGDAKKMMRVAGVPWDEVAFEQLGDTWIYVQGHDCYIRNCLD